MCMGSALIERATVTSEVRRRISHLYILAEDFYRKVKDRALKADEQRSWVEGEFKADLNSTHREILGLLDSLGVPANQPGITGKTLDELLERVLSNAIKCLDSESGRELLAKQMFNILRDYHLTVEMLMRSL